MRAWLRTCVYVYVYLCVCGISIKSLCVIVCVNKDIYTHKRVLASYLTSSPLTYTPKIIMYSRVCVRTYMNI